MAATTWGDQEEGPLAVKQYGDEKSIQSIQSLSRRSTGSSRTDQTQTAREESQEEGLEDNPDDAPRARTRDLTERREELEKKVLVSGAWATVAYIYKEYKNCPARSSIYKFGMPFVQRTPSRHTKSLLEPEKWIGRP